jgi:hypothetical protein
MKDPLRYFIDEGFGNIYSFRNESGRLEARIRWVNDYNNFRPSFKQKMDGTTIISIGGVDYVTDDEFMATYSIEVEDRITADQLISMDNAAWEMTKADLSTINVDS